jgi:hypothetical protein
MSQQIINIGSLSDDHTGTKLRAGGAMINANFSELYSAFAKMFMSGPVSGYKYPQFALGFLQMFIFTQNTANYLFVSQLKCGVTTMIGGASKKLYYMEISLAEDLIGSNVVVASITMAVDNYKSGLDKFWVGPINNSGIDIEVVINWDIFSHETTYNCASYTEGRIWAPCTCSSAVSSGGLPSVPVIVANAIIDGSQPIYIAKYVDHPIVLSLDSENIKGNITMLNKGSEDITVESDNGDVDIQGNSAVIIHPSEVLTLALISITDDDNTIFQFIAINGIIHPSEP